MMHTHDLLALAHAHSGAPCPACAMLVCPGWESMPARFDAALLERLGTLRPPDSDEADLTLEEHHPQGTHSWSLDAPIAAAFYPYNRCEVWACRACHRPFLRYTEYGGYYEDGRIRALLAERIAR